MSYSSEVLADSPIIYWRLGDSSGTTMADSSGNSRPGAYATDGPVGTYPTLGATGALPYETDTAATFNGAYQYGGVASGSAADTALKAISGAFTLEAWVNPSTVSGNRGIIDRYGGGGATESSYLWYMVGDKPTFILRNASNADATLTATTGLSTSTWTHLAATYDGTTMRVYKDGVLDGSLTATFSSHNRSTLLNLGRFVFSGFTFAGTLDEVAIYGSALSGTRISAHYAAAVTLPATISATTPKVTASLSAAYVAPVDVTLAATTQVPGASLSATYMAPVDATLDASTQLPTASLSAQYDPEPVLCTISAETLLPTLTVSASKRSFVTPSTTESSDDFFFGRYQMQVGLSVVWDGTTFVTTPYPWLGEIADLQEGVTWFQGGRTYDINSATASALQAAGYSLTEV